MIILSIETSCDETSIAVTKNGKEVLSNIVFSQIKYHQKFGGVVPEIASRKHLEFITLILKKAMLRAQITPPEIDLVAVTQGPGLVNSLLIGINLANTFAYVHHKPLIGVNHLIGHLYAVQIENNLKFPAVALLVSGGHTELLYITDHFQIQQLGFTLDDAVGEIYDKIARSLNLGYPGGPLIEKLACQGQDIFHFVRPYLKNKNFNFSFSGLKSKIISFINEQKEISEIFVKNLCASFQASIVDVLIEKTQRITKQLKPQQLIITGGVAANYFLKTRFKNHFSFLEVVTPSVKYCTDQAAMIGIAAYYQKKCHKTINKNYDLTAVPNLCL